MAGPYYVRSTDGSDASDGLTWANAKATLVGALAVAVAGERIWVSQVHAETQASAMTLTAAGTAAAPTEIFCGNDAAQPPTALATTATITTTGSFGINLNGHASLYGLTFNVGSGAGASQMAFCSVATTASLVLEQCAFNVLNTGAASRIRLGLALTTLVDQSLVFISCTFRFGAAVQAFQPGIRTLIRGGSVAATGTVPTAMIVPVSSNPSAATIRFTGVDLSAITTALVTVTLSQMLVLFEHCKLGAGVALTTGTNPGPGGPRVFLDYSDSADTQYRMQRHQYEGEVYSETVIVRTGGASNGTTLLSHRMVSSAGRTFYTPLRGPDLMAWNNTVGSSKTASVEILHDSVTNLQDDEIWIELEYLGTSGFPVWSTINADRMTDILSTPADQPASSATWTTTGLTNPNKQRLEITLTAQEIGLVRVRVVLAKPSYTVYIDPLLAFI